MERDGLVRLRRARGQMDREYARPLDVAALARTAFMSSGHFSPILHGAYGESPYSHLMTRRIDVGDLRDRAHRFARRRLIACGRPRRSDRPGAHARTPHPASALGER